MDQNPGFTRVGKADRLAENETEASPGPHDFPSGMRDLDTDMVFGTENERGGDISSSWQKIIVVGGYGHVGSRLSRRLAENFDVLIVGRRVGVAHAVAERLGVTAGDVPVDAATGAGLAALATAGNLVINTSSDQPSTPLLRTAIELGCDYADLGADPVSIAAMRGIESAAKKAGVRALVGAGWAPGTTNILARAAVDGLPGAEHVDVIVLLSVTDDFGSEALNWTLDAITESRTIRVGGRNIVVEPFRHSLPVELRGFGRITAYEFGFPEQFFLPETLPIATASSWCAFQPNVIGRLLAAVARRQSVRSFLAQRSVHSAMVAVLNRAPSGIGAQTVGAVAIARRENYTHGVAVVGTSQADATATSAQLQILAWGDAEAGAGVFLPESVISPPTFLHNLARKGMQISSWTEPDTSL